MIDNRVQHDPPTWVGAGHPTKTDTLNRLLLVECDIDGKGLRRYLKAQTEDPSTESGEVVLYYKDGHLQMRNESDGDVVVLA